MLVFQTLGQLTHKQRQVYEIREHIANNHYNSIQVFLILKINTNCYVKDFFKEIVKKF